MILDLERFRREGEPHWRALEALLDRLDAHSANRIEPAQVEELENLYHRAASDLNRVTYGAPAGALRARLEALTARAYAEVYAQPRNWRGGRARWKRRGTKLWAWLTRRVPSAFRAHVGLFWLALAITLGGCVFGGLAVWLDPAATGVLLPYDYLRNPAQRVASEQGAVKGVPARVPNASAETGFAAMLITHNIQVSLFVLLLGVTLGLGTGLLLFTNGVMIGAVAARYIQQGFGAFVAAWLLPHGAFEIPSVLIAGQAGFLLARTLLRGGREPRWQRLRRVLPDLLTLFGGFCCLLVWAGTVEAFVSQRSARGWATTGQIAAGVLELLLLAAYLGLAGRGAVAKANQAQ